MFNIPLNFNRETLKYVGIGAGMVLLPLGIYHGVKTFIVRSPRSNARIPATVAEAITE